MRTYCHIALLAAQAALSGQPTATAVPKVVFVKGTEIYSVSESGDNLTQLTRDGLAKGLPRWAPDGARIAYSSESPRGWRRINVTTDRGERLSTFEIEQDGMRFIEDLGWLDGTHVLFGGSANPWNCELSVLDSRTGDVSESLEGTCDTFVRSPDGKFTAYWGPEGMGFSAEERRESLEINGVHVYPYVKDTEDCALQFLSKPSWSADSQRLALVDRDVNTGIASVTVLNSNLKQENVVAYGRKVVVRRAPVLMHAALGSNLEEKMEVHWVGQLVVVSKEDGEPLFQADPAHGTIQPATADALQSLAAPRARAAQLKSKAADLVRKLGGRDPDIWTGPQSTAPTN